MATVTALPFLTAVSVALSIGSSHRTRWSESWLEQLIGAVEALTCEIDGFCATKTALPKERCYHHPRYFHRNATPPDLWLSGRKGLRQVRRLGPGAFGLWPFGVKRDTNGASAVV